MSDQLMAEMTEFDSEHEVRYRVAALPPEDNVRTLPVVAHHEPELFAPAAASVDTELVLTACAEWMASSEAAAELGVTSRSVLELIDSGALPAYRMGRVIRMRRRDVEAFLESARVLPGSLAYACGRQS